MKKLIPSLFVCLLLSCSKDMIPYNKEFEKSRQVWEGYKKFVNNSYSYTIYTSSVFGAYTETRIVVQGGRVIGRIYKAGTFSPNTSQLNVLESWTEDSTSLNVHSTGYESITLDKVYEIALQTWLKVSAEKNDIYFSTDANGLIASCGYAAKGCQDDCFTGVRIRAITKQ